MSDAQDKLEAIAREAYRHCPRGEYTEAFRPERVLALLAVVRAAKTYYTGYAQDEADDGESGEWAGLETSYQHAQCRDALALRTALAAFDALEKP